MRQITLALLVAMMLSGAVVAQPVAQAEKPPASQPATTKPTTAAAATVVEATDLDTIKANVGKELAIHGKVSGTYKPASGSVILINFEGVNRDFVAVVKKDSIDAINAGFEGDVANAVKGKTITITGPIELYHDKPEIVISKPEQVKVEKEEAKKAGD